MCIYAANFATCRPSNIFEDSKDRKLGDLGGFQLKDLSISQVINHVTCYKFNSSHGLKLQYPDWWANLEKDFFFEIDFLPMRALESITGHMIYILFV